MKRVNEALHELMLAAEAAEPPLHEATKSLQRILFRVKILAKAIDSAERERPAEAKETGRRGEAWVEEVGLMGIGTPEERSLRLPVSQSVVDAEEGYARSGGSSEGEQ